jgi:hypothetical protein
MELGTWQLPTEDLEGMALTALRVFAGALDETYLQEGVESPTEFCLDVHMIFRELCSRRKGGDLIGNNQKTRG